MCVCVLISALSSLHGVVTGSLASDHSDGVREDRGVRNQTAVLLYLLV